MKIGRIKKYMDKQPDNIGSTNLPPSIIPYDNYYLTDSSVSVSRGYVSLKNNVEWVYRNPIHPQFFKIKIHIIIPIIQDIK